MTDKHQSNPASNRSEGDSLSGFLFALSAYLIWGFLPLYMKTLAHVSPLEVLAHRVVWSVPIALLILLWLGRTADLRAAIANPRMLVMSMLTASIVSLNWGLYIWAVSNGHALDAALGYYINPLFSVLLGSVLLGERLKGIQWLAVLSALIGVAILTWENGGLPLLALGMTTTWGLYAYFKRSLPIGANQGFALEVLLLLPFGLAVMIWLAVTGEGHFLAGPPLDTGLLLGAGLVTAVPLMLYANGAKGLRLSTIAMMQYIAPTMIFITAVYVFGEPFTSIKMLAFAFIWAALVIYSISMIRRPH